MGRWASASESIRWGNFERSNLPADTKKWIWALNHLFRLTETGREEIDVG